MENNVSPEVYKAPSCSRFRKFKAYDLLDSDSVLVLNLG